MSTPTTPVTNSPHPANPPDVKPFQSLAQPFQSSFPPPPVPVPVQPSTPTAPLQQNFPAPSESPGPALSPDSGLPTGDDKKARRQQKNREAAARYREKQKEALESQTHKISEQDVKIKQLEARVADLMQQNMVLVEKITYLEDNEAMARENRGLRDRVLALEREREQVEGLWKENRGLREKVEGLERGENRAVEERVDMREDDDDEIMKDGETKEESLKRRIEDLCDELKVMTEKYTEKSEECERSKRWIDAILGTGRAAVP